MSRTRHIAAGVLLFALGCSSSEPAAKPDVATTTPDCDPCEAPSSDGSATFDDTAADATVADAADADVSPDGGPCGAGKHPAYMAAGCFAAPTCLPDGPEDACASTFCGCDGKTFSGACGYSPKPFVNAGACGEPLETCAPDRLPIAGTACTMANGTYCRLKSCAFGCEDECACRDGKWACTASCRDMYGCGSAPSCTDTCPADASAG